MRIFKRVILLLVFAMAVELVASQQADSGKSSKSKKEAMIRLTVKSDPAGANVIIDSKAVGATPITQELVGGSHRIVVKKDGYKDWSVTIGSSRSDIEIGANLQKATTP